MQRPDAASSHQPTERISEDLKDAFALFDLDGSGSITLSELKQIMGRLGTRVPSDEELQQMLVSVDEDGDGEITFDEFLHCVKSHSSNRDFDRELRHAFDLFDTEGTGGIDRLHLKLLMKKLGLKLSDKELDAMMQLEDMDDDGVISFEEFKAIMSSS